MFIVGQGFGLKLLMVQVLDLMLIFDGVHGYSFIRSDANDILGVRTKWSLSATDAIQLNKPNTDKDRNILFAQDDLGG